MLLPQKAIQQIGSDSLFRVVQFRLISLSIISALMSSFVCIAVNIRLLLVLVLRSDLVSWVPTPKINITILVCASS